MLFCFYSVPFYSKSKFCCVSYRECEDKISFLLISLNKSYIMQIGSARWLNYGVFKLYGTDD